MWQVAHLAVTGSWVWFHLVGVHSAGLTLWQLRQLVVEATGMWVEGLAVAVLPSWQVVQLVAEVKPLWSTLAPLQVVVVLWQLSQAVTPACTAVAGLPTALKKVPVWQVAQVVLSV